MNTDNNNQSQNKRIRLFLWFFGIVILILLILSLLWFFLWRFEKYTDDAYVEGNQVVITPLRDGFITAIHTDDTYLVEKGQLIIELDQTDAIIAVEKKKDNLAKVVRQVCQMFHTTFAYRAEIQVKEAEFIKATQDFEHRKDVINAGGVSLENFEHSEASLRASIFSLERSESLYFSYRALIQGTSIVDHPYVQEAAQELTDALVQLNRCKIYSPETGLTAQRTVQVGMWYQSGDPLLSIIPLDQIWLNANFKETQMKKMRIGQDVKITSDLYGGDVVFNGTILGLPGGAGNAFSLLPPQNLSGNWIKIVQRLPVRVSLNPFEIKRYPLRIGLSMKATVNIRNKKGLLVPTSPEGSPTYSTTIYNLETLGDNMLIDTIIMENLDPTLKIYANTSLNLEE